MVKNSFSFLEALFWDLETVVTRREQEWEFVTTNTDGSYYLFEVRIGSFKFYFSVFKIGEVKKGDFFVEISSLEKCKTFGDFLLCGEDLNLSLVNLPVPIFDFAAVHHMLCHADICDKTRTFLRLSSTPIPSFVIKDSEGKIRIYFIYAGFGDGENGADLSGLQQFLI